MATILLAMLLSSSLPASDWPQFRGPNGDGSTSESINLDWPANGPHLLWKCTLTNGFSSLAISQGRVITQVLQTLTGGKREVVVAYHADSGAMLWNQPLSPTKDPLYDGGGDDGAATNNGGDGPRSTPTIAGQRVLILTSWLALYCLDLTTGNVLWSKDLVALYGAQGIAWQNAASPVVENELAIVNCNALNKTILALRLTDGSLAWQSNTADRMTHSTPVAVDLLGVRQLVFYAQSGLVGLNATNGTVLWRQSATYNGTSAAASPVIATNLVYASAGYGSGARVARISKTGSTFASTQIARTSGANESHWATPVQRQGYLYGIYGTKLYGSAPLKCLRMDTLEEQWSANGFGPGSVILVNGKLLVLTDDGEVVLVDPNPGGYTELRRFKAIAGKCWNVPAVSNGRLYVRSTKELAAFDVRRLSHSQRLRVRTARYGSQFSQRSRKNIMVRGCRMMAHRVPSGRMTIGSVQGCQWIGGVKSDANCRAQLSPLSVQQICTSENGGPGSTGTSEAVSLGHGGFGIWRVAPR